MIKNFKDKNETLRDYNSELLLKILNQTSIEPKNTNDKELFVDENWKINSKHRNNIITLDNGNLQRILSEIFPDKKISIQNNNDGSQTIFIF
jgi:hypothetical protein